MSGLTLNQSMVLVWLRKCGEPATTALIQWHRTHGYQMTPSAIERHLIRLEKKGAVTKATRSDGVEFWSPVQGE